MLQKQGELFGSDIEKYTGLVLPMADSKDRRVLHQHHSVVLTHPAVLERKNTCKHNANSLAKNKSQKKCSRPLGSNNKPKDVAINMVAM